MSTHEKAQIALEYLILTALILIAVSVVFAFSLVNYNENVKIAQIDETLTKMAVAVDDLYARGPGPPGVTASQQEIGAIYNTEKP